MTCIDVIGAGIVGCWQALMLNRQGYQVTLWDPAGLPSKAAASRLAGAMLPPHIEGEAGHELILELGLESLQLWQALYPHTVTKGSLVVAAPRDLSELRRFAEVTTGHKAVDAREIAELEPALAERFPRGLFYPLEAHVSTPDALRTLARHLIEQGVIFKENTLFPKDSKADFVIDCRGMAAKPDLQTLRGVRGERIVFSCPGVELRRPVRLLHPRIAFYIVGWGDGLFMAGATAIESEDAGLPTLRSALELMGAAYALSPEFGEARIVDIAAGVRPAFPDNIPKVILRGKRHILVNGLYRNGFLLAPILARSVVDYIETGFHRQGVIFEDHGEW
jgi:glycine oxidase